MSENATQTVEAAVVKQTPVMAETSSGSVAIYGYGLIGPHFTRLVAECLNIHENLDIGVRSVIILDRPIFQTIGGEREAAVSLFSPDALCISLSLPELWERVFQTVRKYDADDSPSLYGLWTMELMMSILHEVHHARAMLDPEAYELIQTDDDSRKQEEKEAEEWAGGTLIQLAKSRNIEPGPFSEAGWLVTMWQQAIEGSSEEDAAWFEEHSKLLVEGVFWRQKAEDSERVVDFSTFKQFMHLMSEDELDDPSWSTVVDGEPTVISAVEDAQPAENAAVPEPDTTEPVSPQEAGAAMMDGMMVDDGGLGLAGPEDFAGIMGMMGEAMEEYGGYPVSMEPIIDSHTPPPQPQGQVVTNTQFPVANQQPQQPQQPVQPLAQQPVNQPQPTQNVTGQVQVYQPNGLTPQQIGAIVQGVATRIYEHIFTYCGRQLQSDVAFATPEAVCSMPIQLTPQEQSVIVKCNAQDAQGRWCPGMPTTNGLIGSVTKSTKLPCYKIFINDNGPEKVRFIIPQNVNKRDGSGQLTKPAQMARGGSCIMYVMEGNDTIAEQTGKKFIFKIVDGVLQAC
jgi:hypothetical protein